MVLSALLASCLTSVALAQDATTSLDYLLVTKSLRVGPLAMNIMPQYARQLGTEFTYLPARVCSPLYGISGDSTNHLEVACKICFKKNSSTSLAGQQLNPGDMLKVLNIEEGGVSEIEEGYRENTVVNVVSASTNKELRISCGSREYLTLPVFLQVFKGILQ